MSEYGRPERFGRLLGFPLAAPALRWIRNASLYASGIGGGSRTTMSGEEHVMRLVQPGGLVLDVGAHAGEWARHMLHVLPSARIHSFEPMPVPFARLRHLDVRAHQVAICDVEGTLAMRGHGQTARLAPDGERDVEARTLDSYTFDSVDLLKIDVEGRELRVLDGAKKTLERTRIVQWEMSPTSIEERAFLKDFFDRLHARFTIHRIARHGLVHIPRYDEHEEAFLTTNYVAIRRDDAAVSA